MTQYADQGVARRHTVSQRVRSRRRSLGLTQQDVVARLARVGVMTTNRAMSTIERGAGVDVAKLPELARCLECSVTYLLGLTDDAGRWTPDTETPNTQTMRSRRRLPHSDSAEARVQPRILGPDVPDLRRPVPEGDR